MTDEPAPSGTAYDRLASQIRREILSGRLQAGERLPVESKLSAHYQVSRNTAREAMRSLASQGLLVVKRGVGGGAFVAIPTPNQVSDSLEMSIGLLADADQVSLRQITDVREMLEIPAAELAASRRSDEDIAALGAALAGGSQSHPDLAFTQGRRFHLGVLAAAHNPALEVVAKPLFEVLQSRVHRSGWPRKAWRDVDSEHRAILDRVRNRDQEGAREAARAHMSGIRRLYGDLAG